MTFDVKLSCPNGHAQVVRIHQVSREMAQDFGDLIAGRSRFYVAPIPDDAIAPAFDSPVGFCHACRARINPCEVLDVDAA